MKNFWWLFAHTLKGITKSKKQLILYIGAPLIGVFLSFMTNANGGAETLNIGILDQDGGEVAQDTVTFLKGLDHVKISEETDASASSKIASGKMEALITFEKGFSQSVKDGKPSHIGMTSLKGAQVTGYVSSYLYNYMNSAASIGKSSGGDEKAFQAMYADFKHSPIQTESAVLKDTSNHKEMTYSVIGYLIIIMLYSAGNLTELMIKERENRTYYRLLSTPITSKQYVLANAAVNIIIMAVQIIFAVLFMGAAFHIHPSFPLWQLFVLMMLFALSAIGIAFIAVGFSNSSSSASALLNLIVVPTCLLAGCFFPGNIMPKTVQTIAEFLPQRWVLDTVDQLHHGRTLQSLTLNIIILGAFAAALLLIAAYRFSVKRQTQTFM
ncbi:ABC transporter permease [Bacillus velezensis]|uniref:ABC transporter permease n=1 Tax=Bacillus velezensis TaxID=492670 RepID=UPI001E48814E|nr:ABC transporter permease [Bacillus velezensis]UFH22031.1 ABC transporter permease [Bacillus velezensis]